jgi:hypothetical protein
MTRSNAIKARLVPPERGRRCAAIGAHNDVQ